MKKLFLPLILLIIMVLESTAVKILPDEWFLSDSLIIPHWTLVFLILIAVFYDRDSTYYSLLYGIIFGFLVDLTYTNILGVYMFSYGFVAYIIHELKKLFHPNAFIAILLTIVGLAMSEHIIYFIYYMIGVTDLTWTTYSTVRLIPTLLGNILFLLILLPLVRRKLLKWSNEQLPEK